MAAKPEAPMSYRPGKARLERLRAYQARKNLQQSEALHRLLDIGLDAEEGKKESEPVL